VKYNYLTEENINQFIDTALAEDIGDGDHTSLSSIPESEVRKAKLIMKASGIIAGIEMALKIFTKVDSSLIIETFKTDGDSVTEGDIILTVKGKAQNILTAERLALNCLQRMSGIATYVNSLQKMINHTKATVLDTRKTTPNFRVCEKWAVKIGGGTNHRYGLFDMIILKDNHVDYAGGVQQAVDNCKKYLKEKGLNLPIEVETRDLKEVEEAIDANVDRIMLDNMSNSMMAEAVKLINGKTEVEASGGITEKTIVGVAETGVDFISIGALTHSYTSLDMSLKAQN